MSIKVINFLAKKKVTNFDDFKKSLHIRIGLATQLWSGRDILNDYGVMVEQKISGTAPTRHPFTTTMRQFGTIVPTSRSTVDGKANQWIVNDTIRNKVLLDTGFLTTAMDDGASSSEWTAR